MDEQAPKFKVNGREYAVPTDLTLGEMCDAEKEFGVEFGSSATSGVRMVAALLWIAVSRDDPSVTPSDIRDLPADVFASLVEEGEAQPLEQGERPNGSNGTSGESSSTATDAQAETLEATGIPV